MVTAYLGFGANLGDPIQQILDARRQLSAITDISIVVNSSFYLTSPIGYQGQSDFVNCVTSIDTSLSAHSLLDIMQSIETSLGRVRDSSNRNAPRLIDIDLLLYGDSSINDDRLIVPHPRLEQRLFTLAPLSEIAPTLILGHSSTVTNVLNKGHDDGVFTGQVIHRLT